MLKIVNHLIKNVLQGYKKKDLPRQRGMNDNRRLYR